MATKKRGASVPRPRSGWVSEDDRSTVQFKIRCSPELAAQARAVAKKRGMTLADVLAAGVASLSNGTPTDGSNG